MAGGRRSSFEVRIDILRSLAAERGRLKPTHVMYKANLSHKLLKEYLDELKEKNLIEETYDKQQKFIALTEKGWSFLRQFREFQEFRETFGI